MLKKCDLKIVASLYITGLEEHRNVQWSYMSDSSKNDIKVSFKKKCLAKCENLTVFLSPAEGLPHAWYLGETLSLCHQSRQWRSRRTFTSPEMSNKIPLYLCSLSSLPMSYPKYRISQFNPMLFQSAPTCMKGASGKSFKVLKPWLTAREKKRCSLPRNSVTLWLKLKIKKLPKQACNEFV